MRQPLVDAGASDGKLRREVSIQKLADQGRLWDLLVIGGGATGIAIAMDAATRGMDVALVERSDFGSGTSSNSTKLIHGGVRYLKQGNISLVRDALRERSLLMRNAPELVLALQFFIPCSSFFERQYYGLGLKLYDALASRDIFPRSRSIDQKAANSIASALRADAYSGGVCYFDGQFDDMRLLLAMARTATRFGACISNYVEVTGFEKDIHGQVVGAELLDKESGKSFRISAKSIINAAGPFCDEVRSIDDPTGQPLVAASQGIHLVVPSHCFPGNTALIVPKTSDGRVIFVIPWHDCVIIGTTDTALERPSTEPRPLESEVDFLLETTAKYLSSPPMRSDVLSVFAGIRPLVRGGQSDRTAALSRDHVIRRSASGLVTITGGKWTTVRKMAEDCIDSIIDRISPEVLPCQTRKLRIRGSESLGELTLADVSAREPSRAFVQLAVQSEMARNVEDFLARRSRLLYLDAKQAFAVSRQVAEWIADERGLDQTWVSGQVEQFEIASKRYSV